MGYEEDIVGTAVRMIFKKEFPPEIPKGPRPRQEGEDLRDPPIYGGSVNHSMQANMARLLWACEKGGSALAESELGGATRMLEFQLTKGFMCRANACEQTSPSHTQQHLSAVVGLLYVGLTYQIPALVAQCQAWLAGSFELSGLGWVPQIKKVILPGARHFTDKATKQPVGGANYQNNRLYGWIVGDSLSLPKNAHEGDPLKNIDDFALVLCARFPGVAGAVLNAGHGPIPPLRWPMSVYRRGKDFVAYLPEVGGATGVQRMAGWVGGTEVYGFDFAENPGPWAEREGWSKLVILGGPVHVGAPSPGPTDPIPEPPEPEPLPDSKEQIAKEMHALATRLEKLP
jgi:hypothetical protein